MNRTQSDPTDRFAAWPRFSARLLLLVVAALLVFAAVVPISAGKMEKPTVGFCGHASDSIIKSLYEKLKLINSVVL